MEQYTDKMAQVIICSLMPHDHANGQVAQQIVQVSLLQPALVLLQPAKVMVGPSLIATSRLNAHFSTWDLSREPFQHRRLSFTASAGAKQP